jgi:hypothetical protein
MSDEELTGYDNHDAASARLDEEVFLYHAPPGVGEAGTLICASCNPTGGRPHGVEFSDLEASGGHVGLAGGGSREWPPSQWLAASVPSWTSNLYQSRYLSDNGRLFFNSSDALVPQDTNETEDVYEYEPPAGAEAAGSDTCSAGAPTYSPRSDGCIALISSGRSSEESSFLDASEDGDDVFFLTGAKLAPQDVDKALDVYDAHVCSASAPCAAPPATKEATCEENDFCQATAEAPKGQTPGSLSFEGPENLVPPVPVKPPALTPAQELAKALKACKKDKHKSKRVSCEMRARKRFGPHKKAKKATRGGHTRGAR